MILEKVVDVGNEFYHRLAHRDERQGDGKHTAVEFREKYLSGFEDPDAWRDEGLKIVLDFSNVKKIGPGFANEAFTYFTPYAKDTRDFMKHIEIRNASPLQYLVIFEELEKGFE